LKNEKIQYNDFDQKMYVEVRPFEINYKELTNTGVIPLGADRKNWLAVINREVYCFVK